LPGHQAGADLKTLQELLGHASVVITADIYTSVLPAAQRESMPRSGATGRGMPGSGGRRSSPARTAPLPNSSL
jgi:hypothetical protein